MNEPSISVRKYIRWIPGIATEPTSTLVLTSASRRFIDIRIFKNPHDEHDLPNEGTHPGGPMSRLEWAFSGLSSSTLRPPQFPAENPISHSTWTHDIDSNTDGPVIDEGDMYPQADGIHTLELGQMVNPETGKLTQYEENWVDSEVTEVGSESGKRWSVVLALDDEENGVKGEVIRVGQWCQGIIKAKGEVAIERWQWVVEGTEEGSKGDWKRVARLGRLFLPCSFTFKPEMVTEGNVAQYGDYKWIVKEVFSW